MSEKIYVWSAREKTFDDGGIVLNVSINKAKFDELADVKGYVKLKITRRKQEDDFGNTHSVEWDSYWADKSPF